jgi:hypothetical protein
MEFIVRNAIFEDVDNSTIISNPKAFSATVKEYSIEEDSEGNEFVVNFKNSNYRRGQFLVLKITKNGLSNIVFPTF